MIDKKIQDSFKRYYKLSGYAGWDNNKLSMFPTWDNYFQEYENYKSKLNNEKKQQLEYNLAFFINNFPIKLKKAKLYSKRKIASKDNSVYIKDINLKEFEWNKISNLDVDIFLFVTEETIKIDAILSFNNKTEFVLYSLKQ